MVLQAAALLAACSVLSVPEDPAQELTAVPFFPQTIYQCGPAALATVLTWSGAAATPEALAPQVYIPARQGSLAIELVAATRRAGRIPWVLAPDAEALVAELRAGHPVLVLQDLGAAWVRRWHFAVVVGVDEARNAVVLRSGTERRRVERSAQFHRSWERAGRWALLVLPPDQLPATASPAEVVRVIEDAAGLLPAGAASTAYAAALARWPVDATVLFAAANHAYAGARLAEADRLYRRLLAAEPQHVAGRNNYANLLLDRGCPAAAAAEARQALGDLDRDTTGGGRFRDAVEETLQRADALAGDRSRDPTCFSMDDDTTR